MSPIPKTGNLVIRRFCQLLLTINSLGTLLVVIASRSGPPAPRTTTSLAVHRLRPLLAGPRHLGAGNMALPAPMHHAATPGPVPGAAAATPQVRQSLWCSYSALIGGLTSPPGLHPSSRRTFPSHTTCGTCSPLLTSSSPPGLPAPSRQMITASGNRHLPMAVISSD